MNSPLLDVSDNTTTSRYEARIGGDIAGWIDYRPAGGSVILAETHVVQGHGGKGLGSALVLEALARITEDGKTVIPTCPFVLAFMRRHPEMVGRIDPRLRDQFR